MNEAQVAEVPAAAGAAASAASAASAVTELYFNSRTRGTIERKPGEVRATSRSSDGGATFALPVAWDASLPEPGAGCQGSVLGLPAGAPRTLLFSNPHNAAARLNMTVRRSDDGGRTWRDGGGYVVHPGGSAYSCLTELSSGKISGSGDGDSDGVSFGLLHERDATKAAECSGPSCESVFSIIPLASV